MLASLLISTGPAAADSLRFNSFADLDAGYLQRVPHWIVQPRNGQNILESRHRQHSAQCMFFSMGMVAEQLNFSRYEQNVHYDATLRYMTDQLRGAVTDVGYFGSSEHLAAEYEAYRSREGAVDQSAADGVFFGNLFNQSTATATCDGYFQDGVANTPIPRYGQCSPPSNQFETWLNASRGGCGNVAGVGNTCIWTARLGMYGYMNRRTVVGCNDARPFSVETENDVTVARMIIKGFIDNNIPLIMVSRGGQHFMPIIGYADVGNDDLPRAIIVSNTHLTRNSNFKMQCSGKTGDPQEQLPTISGPRPKFWVYEDLDEIETWTDWGLSNGTSACDGPSPPTTAAELTELSRRQTAFLGNVRALIVWNQHLNGGCEPGGWARQLDQRIDAAVGPEGAIDPANVRRLCPMPTTIAPSCEKPFFGVRVECLVGGRAVRTLHTSVEDLFITEPRPTACDAINVFYADGGSATVTGAELQNFAYDPVTGYWRNDPATLRSAGTIDARAPVNGYSGRQSVAHWRTGDLGASYDLVETRRFRSRIKLDFDDATTRYIEIAPPNTYGIQIRCERSADPRHRVYELDPDRQFFENRTFVVEPENTACDNIALDARLGYGRRVTQARITRYGRNATTKEWEEFQSWDADQNSLRIPPGHPAIAFSGEGRLFEWTTSWPENFLFVARDREGVHDQRKVRFTLALFDGSERIIEIVPTGDPRIVTISTRIRRGGSPPQFEAVSENIDDAAEEAAQPDQAVEDCPAGTIIDENTGDCVAAPAEVEEECPAGTVVDEQTGECVAGSAEPEEECPAGTVVDEQTGACVAEPVASDEECPAGTVIDEQTGECVAEPAQSQEECPPGTVVDERTGECVAEPSQQITCVGGTVRNGQCLCTGGRVARRDPDRQSAYFCSCPGTQRWDPRKRQCVATITCRFGKVAGNRCVCDGGRIAKPVPGKRDAFFCGCRDGQRWDKAKRQCVAEISCRFGKVVGNRCVCDGGRIAKPIRGKRNAFFCGCRDGQVWDKVKRQCIVEISCRFGKVVGNRCVCDGGRIAKPVPKQRNAFFCGCPKGLKWNRVARKCIK
ncbi:MAG: hypothetical protein C0606_06040 [Hyphomicrobiales bacterium]|nr:MAG: hypothetical protein C0606_06040 [Hyphomicrobiales bacterium]